jgi:TusA-related sulfurtransferase
MISPARAGDAQPAVHRLNLDGIPCPINFAKIRVELAGMKPGDLLDVLLDDGEPIRNVPESVRASGEIILSKSRRADGRWMVRIEKA